MSCDCLNDCGDDPWLKDGSGRAAPCENMLARQERERVVTQQLATIAALRQTYGADNVFDLIEKMHTELQAARNAALSEGIRVGNLERALAVLDEKAWVEDGVDLAQIARIAALEAGLNQARRELQIAYLGRSHGDHHAALDRITAALEEKA